MKRLLSSITLLLAVSLYFTVNAQSLEEILRTADSLKVAYGETDSRYLDVLSKAVPIAYNEGNLDTAIEIRRAHTEIIKKIYGEKSWEYAEDIWRLGNIIANSKQIDSIEYYEKVVAFLKSIKQEGTVLFCSSQWGLYWAYREKNDWSSAINAMNQFVKNAPTCVGIDWKGNSIQHIDIANGYFWLGNAYGGIVKNNELALNAFEKCVSMLEENDLFNDYVYTSAAVSSLSNYYFFAQNYEKALNWRLRSAEMTARLKGVNSDDYINELILLRGCYSFLEDSENEIATQEQALSLIQARNKEKGIEDIYDEQYLKELDYLYNAYSLAHRRQDELAQLRKLLSIYEKREEIRSEIYLKYLDRLAFFYHVEGDYTAEYQLFDKYDEIAKFLGKNETEEYYRYLSNKVTVLSSLFKKIEFNEAESQLRALAEQIYGPYSSQRLSVEVATVSYLALLEQIPDAKERLGNCYDLLNSGMICFENKTDSLAVLGDLNVIEGQLLRSSAPMIAEGKFLKAMDICSQLQVPMAAVLNELGLLYFLNLRNSRQALDIFNRAKEELKRDGQSNSILFITILSNIAACNQDLGMSSDAIAAFDEAEETVKKYYGETHPMYGVIAQNKSKFYSELSDYDTAIVYAKEAASCIKSIYGDKSEQYAICLHNLSILYGVKGSIEESKELIRQSAPILETASVPYAISSYCCLFCHYAHDTNWDGFYALVNKCSELINDNQLQGTDVEAMFLAEAGSCLKEKDKSEALNYLSRAIQVYETLGVTSSMIYIRILLEYYQSLVTDELQSDSVIPNLTDAYKNLYFANVIFFNAAEREQFVTSPSYSKIKDIVFSARSSKSQDSQLFDYLLFSKGLLLETSVNYAKSIYDSNNNELIEQFSRLIELKKILGGEKKKSDEVSIEELQVQATGLERRITTYLKENGGYNDGLNYKYQDVAGALKNSEAAIEFVSYHDYLEDTDYYAALVVKKEWTSPEFIMICKKPDLEKYLSISPANLYGESIASKEAYSLIWGQIIPLLSDIKTIYYSPAGCLNRLAIDQLYDGKKRFNDYYKALRLTSTRLVCLPTHPVKYSAAILYGGLFYDEDDETMLAESQNVRGENSSPTVVFRGFDGSVTRKGWEYLPGSLEEVNQISSIISKNRIKCDVYTSGRGNEETFKALSGGKFNILHLATHGFYMTESQAEKNRFYTSNPFNDTYISNEVSPLKRSGLLLAGGNKAWRGEPVPAGVEDGVLTAEEIASVDLRNCDVVVLSACETGLGEITDEGVYGLQRAFKNAGVKSIIMSLWEVDDEATSFMMQSFYRNLLKGMNKREAFELAQKEAKKKYIDPRYWAAFIMLD